MKYSQIAITTLLLTLVDAFTLPTTFAASKDPAGKGYPKVYSSKFKKS